MCVDCGLIGTGWAGVILVGLGWDRNIFVGVGQDQSENPLLCHKDELKITEELRITDY